MLNYKTLWLNWNLMYKVVMALSGEFIGNIAALAAAHLLLLDSSMLTQLQADALCVVFSIHWGRAPSYLHIVCGF